MNDLLESHDRIASAHFWFGFATGFVGAMLVYLVALALQGCAPLPPPRPLTRAQVGFSAVSAPCPSAPVGCFAHGSTCTISNCFCPVVCAGPFFHPVWATTANGCGCV